MEDSSFGSCYRSICHGEIQTLSLSAYTICTHACMNPRHRLEVWCNIHMHRQPNPHSVWGFLVRNHGATSKLFHCVLKNTPLHTYVWATHMQWLSSGTSYLRDYWRASPSPGSHGWPSL